PPRHRVPAGPGRAFPAVLALTRQCRPRMVTAYRVGTGSQGTRRARSVGDVERGDHLPWCDPDDQFAGYAVAAAEFLGAIGAHVAPAYPGRDVEQVGRVLADRCGALDLNEGVRRLFVIDAEGDPWIPPHRPCFRGVLIGVEHQGLSVDDEPHRYDERSAVGGHVPELSGAGALGQEGDHVVGELHSFTVDRRAVLRGGVAATGR